VGTEIKDRDIALFIGDTGSGKTTLIKALLGYKMGFRFFKGMRYITIVEPVDNPKVKKMESNPQCRSVSRYVVAVRPKESMTNKEIYLTDTPGFVDTGGVEV
jgi:GTPase SAR1 family protein